MPVRHIICVMLTGHTRAHPSHCHDPTKEILMSTEIPSIGFHGPVQRRTCATSAHHLALPIGSDNFCSFLRIGCRHFLPRSPCKNSHLSRYCTIKYTVNISVCSGGSRIHFHREIARDFLIHALTNIHLPANLVDIALYQL